MFYNPNYFEKIVCGGGSMNNDVYSGIAGEGADFLASGEMSRFDFRLDLRKVTTPMLVLAGRYDRIAFPHWTIRYKHYAPRAKFVMLEKSGLSPSSNRARKQCGFFVIFSTSSEKTGTARKHWNFRWGGIRRCDHAHRGCYLVLQ